MAQESVPTSLPGDFPDDFRMSFPGDFHMSSGLRAIILKRGREENGYLRLTEKQKGVDSSVQVEESALEGRDYR